MPPAAEVQIRVARPDDVPHATRIIADALAEFGLRFDPDGRDADVKDFGSRPEHDDLVAEGHDGTPIGVASLGPQGHEGVGWLSKLFLAKEARGRGVGRALLDAAHDAATRRGYHTIGLRTRTAFLDAIALYEKNGYVVHVSSTLAVPLEVGDRVFWRLT